MKGQGAKATAVHYLDIADARILLNDLAWGKPVDYVEFKGSNGDKPISRVLKVKTNDDKVWFRLENGLGQVIGQRAVKPRGKPETVVNIPLTTSEARRLTFAVLAHLDAWTVITFRERTGGGAGADPLPHLQDVPCTTRVYLEKPMLGVPEPVPGQRGRKPTRLRVLNGVKPLKAHQVARRADTHIRYPVLIALVVLCLVAVAQAATGNIDPTNKWAWGTNVGWINFRPEHGGVTVYDDHLEGYAWGENIG